MTPRRSARGSKRSSSRVASLLFGLGCLVVLGGTFALGVAAGRRWPSGLPGLGGAPAATAATPSAARGERDASRRETRGLDKDKARTTTEGAPVLTFYHDLTAPLASTPPPPRALPRPDARAAQTIKPAARTADALRPVASDSVALAEPPALEKIPPPTGEPRFTVQVGAFKARSQAEVLRARLAGEGQEAYVTEVEAGGVTQYRVRVGTFATRAAARDAAMRIAGERRLATYVTTR